MAVTLNVGEKVTLTALPVNDDGNPNTTASVSFSGSDQSVAEVVTNGDRTATVIARAAGTTDVTAYATDADGHTAHSDPDAITVVVPQPPAPVLSAVTISDGTPVTA